MDIQHYLQGNCAVMALALNRIYDLPFAIFAGVIGDEYEFCHAVVVKDLENYHYIDATGEHIGVPENLVFNEPIEKVVLLPMFEQDVREAFTVEDIAESEIISAIDFYKKYHKKSFKPR